MMSSHLKGCCVSLCFSLLSAACGNTKPPASVSALNELASESASEELAVAAPGAWAEARRYLAMANEASEKGDTEQADRFAKLGALHARIARASAEQAATSRRIAEAEGRKEALREELSAVSRALDNLEARIERERMRRHLEMVVDKTRLAAAAEEELRERLLTKQEKGARRDARRLVGLEMIERARTWRDVVEVLVRGGALVKGEARLVEGPLNLALERQEAGDLAGVQQYVEESGIEARRLVENAWSSLGQDPLVAVESVKKEVESAGYQVIEEEFGCIVRLSAKAAKPARGDEKWIDKVASLGKMLLPFTDVACVLIASQIADLARADEVVKAASAAMARAGITGDRFRVRNAGEATPFTALRGARDTLAILLVPIPKKR